MTKISKKEVKHTVEEALRSALVKFDITKPSKKTEKLMNRFSKKIAIDILRTIKKKAKADRPATSQKSRAKKLKQD